MSEETGDNQQPAEQSPAAVARFRNRPLIPEAGAAGAPLTAVISVMAFLAAIAMSALLFINAAARAWVADLQSEVTIQIKGADDAAIAADTDEILTLLRETPGVIEATQMSREDSTALLEPWLGKGNVEAFINVPAIIEVKIAPELRENLGALRDSVAAIAPDAALDDHAAWHDRLAAASRSGQALAFAVYALVMLAACAISAFAARAGLAANREIVSVLHLVGATDGFIANEVQRRFVALGVRGAAIGLAVAAIVLFSAGLLLRAGVAPGVFLPNLALSPWHAFWLLLTALAIIAATGLTARIAVLRELSKQY